MTQLYRGHCIEVVRLKDHIYHHIERLRDGTTVSEGEYESAWRVKEVFTDLRAAIDLQLGTLDESG